MVLMLVQIDVFLAQRQNVNGFTPKSSFHIGVASVTPVVAKTITFGLSLKKF
jgi:hypothetical protein